MAKSSHEMGVAKMIEKFMMELAAPTTKHSATGLNTIFLFIIIIVRHIVHHCF